MKTDPKPKVGELFTRVYLPMGEPTHDSVVFRKRLAAYVQHDLHKDHWNLATFLKKESGSAPNFVAGTGYLDFKMEDYFTRVSRDELLNAITLIWRFLSDEHKTWTGGSYKSASADNWLAFVRRTLLEENVGYTVDDLCGVRYTVDRQFEVQRESVLQCLEGKRYAAALAAFEDAHRHFSAIPQDTKASIRSLFESLEIVVKNMAHTDKLNAKIVSTEIKAKALKATGPDSVAQRAIGRVLDGFADWVDGLHNYRHGQGVEEPVTPSVDFCIYCLSSGAAYLRWLVQIDQATGSTQD